jgi:ribosome maturation factor RimP
MITEKQVAKLANEHLEGTENFLVEVALRSGNRISVYIDGDHRVTIEICRQLSRFIEDNLDRDSEDYDLTVSSAGADRPLKLPRQYRKNIGNELEVVTLAGDSITGTVVSAGEDGIVIECQPPRKKGRLPEKTVVALTFDQIKSAKEVISFKK